jgi:hypothetical protein
MLKKIVQTVLLGVLFSACTGKQPTKEESAFIVIKTPRMKYADLGFISNAPSLVKVNIYASGQPLVKFEINALNVCMSTFECMNKKAFNKKILSENYPDTLLEDIFRAKPIFDKENLQKNADGFTQKLKKEKAYDIHYTVKNGTRTFRDKINKILIKVREQ